MTGCLPAFCSGEEFLAEVRTAAAARPDRLQAWWVGQSGFLVAWAGRWLLFDPYLSDSLTRKYAATDRPHVRMTARVVDPARLGGVSVVTASHHHTDHLDPETLRPLAEANPGLVLVGPEAIRGLLRERSGLPDGRIVGLDADGESDANWVEVGEGTFRFRAIPAAHEALDTDARGRALYLGFVVRAGPWTLYHAGDTVRYPGQVERLRRTPVDLAFLPINGREASRRVSGNLWGREAAELAQEAGIRCVVPCHYGMFTFNTAPPDEFVARCGQLGQPHRVLQPGEGLAWRVGAPGPG
ncbi:MAG: MBL fold metallo-hydrolase [Verrucomicrobiota bacterium]